MQLSPIAACDLLYVLKSYARATGQDRETRITPADTVLSSRLDSGPQRIIVYVSANAPVLDGTEKGDTRSAATFIEAMQGFGRTQPETPMLRNDHKILHQPIRDVVRYGL